MELVGIFYGVTAVSYIYTPPLINNITVNPPTKTQVSGLAVSFPSALQQQASTPQPQANAASTIAATV